MKSLQPAQIKVLILLTLGLIIVIADPGLTSTDSNLIRLEAELDACQEVTPSDSRAFGIGLFELNKNDNTLFYDIKTFQLEGNITKVHIHGFAMPGVEAPVLLPLATSTPLVGIWYYDEGRELSILSDMTYVNIHTDKYPKGEIRGQIEIKR